MTRPELPRRIRGFTLLEVLVAFLVAALLITVILSAFAGGARNLAKTDQIALAALVAQSRLAELGVVAPLQAGVEEGVSDDGLFHWRVRVEPLAWEFAAGLSAQGAALQRVDVEVSWTGGGRDNVFALTTLRTLGAAGAEQ